MDCRSCYSVFRALGEGLNASLGTVELLEGTQLPLADNLADRFAQHIRPAHVALQDAAEPPAFGEDIGRDFVIIDAGQNPAEEVAVDFGSEGRPDAEPLRITLEERAAEAPLVQPGRDLWFGFDRHRQ